MRGVCVDGVGVSVYMRACVRACVRASLCAFVDLVWVWVLVCVLALERASFLCVRTQIWQFLVEM